MLTSETDVQGTTHLEVIPHFYKKLLFNKTSNQQDLLMELIWRTGMLQEPTPSKANLLEQLCRKVMVVKPLIFHSGG